MSLFSATCAGLRSIPVTRDVDRRHVAEDVAAAGRDGGEMLAGLEVERLEIDDRVFPDLRIDEPGEGEREKPLLECPCG